MPFRNAYGNLYAYKLYTLPNAKRLFGSYSFRRYSKSKHHTNVQKMLEILALNGPLTTWEMAKIVVHDKLLAIRTKEKEYRRLLKGRKDRGRHSTGVLDIGLVIRDRKRINRGPADVYRLSLHGILYCLDVLELTNKEIDKMAKQYSDVLPLVFGKWDYLKSMMEENVYRLKTLGSGILSDNIQITKISKFPVFELLSYVSIKYQENFEHIEEKDLADQISYWFYTHLLLSKNPKENNTMQFRTWKNMLGGDPIVKKWYYEFVSEAMNFYDGRFSLLKKIKTK